MLRARPSVRPDFVILFGLMLGYSAPLRALPARSPACRWRCCADDARGHRLETVIEALVDGARNTLSVAMACACAGIVIGVVTITGLGIVFTQFVVGPGAELAAARRWC